MSEPQTVDLSSLLLPSKAVEFEHPFLKGFKVTLCHKSREEMAKIRKKSITSKFDRKTRQPTDEFDEDLFLNLYCKAVIIGWTGLTVSKLEELLLVDISKVDDPETAIVPYSQESAIELMKNSVDFDMWVTETVSDIGNFTTAKSEKSTD